MALTAEHKRTALGNIGAELTDDEFHLVCKEISAIIDARKSEKVSDKKNAEPDFDDEKE